MATGIGLNVRRHENTCKGCRRKLFNLSFWIPGKPSLRRLETLCDKAMNANRVLDLAPAKHWLPDMREQRIHFSGVICSGDPGTARYAEDDEGALRAFESIAKTVGAALWKNLARSGIDYIVGDLNYEHRSYEIVVSRSAS